MFHYRRAVVGHHPSLRDVASTGFHRLPPIPAPVTAPLSLGTQAAAAQLERLVLRVPARRVAVDPHGMRHRRHPGSCLPGTGRGLPVQGWRGWWGWWGWWGWGRLNSASATTAQQLRLSNYGSATTAQQPRLSNHGSATTAQQPRLSNHGSATKLGSRFSNYASATTLQQPKLTLASATTAQQPKSTLASATKPQQPKPTPSGKYMHSLILHVISKSHPLWQVQAQPYFTRNLKIQPLWQVHAQSHLTHHIKIPPPLASTCTVSSYTSYQNPSPSGNYMHSLILHVISKSLPLWELHAQSHLTRHIKIPPPLASTGTATFYT